MALVLRKAVLTKNVSLLKCIKGRSIATPANNKKNPAVLSHSVTKKNCVIEQRLSLATDVPRMKMCQAPRATAAPPCCRPALRSASCPNFGEEPLETLLRSRSRSTPNISNADNYMASPPMFPNYFCSSSCAPPPVSSPYYSANRRPDSLTKSRTGRVQPPNWIKDIAWCGVCPCPCGPCGPCCGGCCPCPGTPAGGCSLPPPCNTPPKCIQYMNGYYYYPYGFWFCGPYHVSGTCVPGGPVQAGPCGPCGPAPPCPGGPCGPACIGPCCMATDFATLLPESPYQATLQSGVDNLPKVENLIPQNGLLSVLMRKGSKGSKIDTNYSNLNSKESFRKVEADIPIDGALSDNLKAQHKEIPLKDSKEETRIIATLAMSDPVTTAAATLACGCPSGIAPRPCGCGCPWPGGCAPPGYGCCGCGPCGCSCGPCGCGPCGPCGYGPCGPCGYGPCGPCGCGPCGPCGCGPSGPCGCGPCSPYGCGPCCCGLFAGPCMNIECPTPMPVRCAEMYPSRPGGSGGFSLPKLCVLDEAMNSCKKASGSPPVDQPEQYFYTPCPVNLTPKPLPSSSRFVVNPNIARNHPFNQMRFNGRMPLFERLMKHCTTGHALCEAHTKSCQFEKSVFDPVTSEPVEPVALYESTKENVFDAQDTEETQTCDIGKMKFRKIQPTFSTEAVMIRRLGESFSWTSE